MASTGLIRGTHHLTFCVGGAQEDYDFHVRLLGLKSVKKTVLFDGEIPIYHLYYGNELGDASTLLTSFPYRQAGWMGKRGTNQAKQLNLSIPPDAIALSGPTARRGRSRGAAPGAVRYRAADLRASVRDPVCAGRRSGPDDRAPYEGGGVPAEHAIRGAYGTTTSVREVGEMDFFITTGMQGELMGSEGPSHQYRIGTEDGLRPRPGARRGARPAAGHVALRRGHDPPSGVRCDLGGEPAGGQGLDRRPRVHRRLRPQGPGLFLLLLLPQPRRSARRARLLHAGRAS